MKKRWKETGFLLQLWQLLQRFGDVPRFLVQFISHLIMKITYNPEADVLKLFFQEGAVEKSDREQPDRILNYDKDGNLVTIEFLNIQMVEYSVISSKSEAIESAVGEEPEPLSLSDRRAFMQLPLAERRRILSKQAEAMVEHYEKETAWGANFKGGDIIDY